VSFLSKVLRRKVKARQILMRMN